MHENIEFFSSGSTLLNGVLGGGWASGVIINLQGEPSAGKTLLAEEALAYHLSKWPDGPVWWRDSENAFMEDYARRIGIPVEKIDFLDDIFTVEDWFNALTGVLEEFPENEHGLFVLDSLDALSDDAEMARDIKEGTFGATKPRKLSEIFRRIQNLLAGKHMTVMVIQQLRDQLNSPVPSKKASGGLACQFYASQVIRVAELGKNGKEKQTRKGIEKIVGVNIQAKCTKNRVGRPFRDCKFRILFDYGVDDACSNLEWLETTAKTNKESAEYINPILEGITPIDGKSPADNVNTYCKKFMELPQEQHSATFQEIAKVTARTWADIESKFDVKVTKPRVE